jgi:hypothetical protein
MGREKTSQSAAVIGFLRAALLHGSALWTDLPFPRARVTPRS